MTDNPLLSAQVVLRSASGDVARDDQLTADRISRFAPSPEAAARAAESFERLGFTVGPLVGNSFSITAPRATFESVFSVDLAHVAKRSGRKAKPARGESNLLPTSKLPKAVAALVSAVTFTPPPDFGPGNFA